MWLLKRVLREQFLQPVTSLPKFQYLRGKLLNQHLQRVAERRFMLTIGLAQYFFDAVKRMVLGDTPTRAATSPICSRSRMVDLLTVSFSIEYKTLPLLEGQGLCEHSSKYKYDLEILSPCHHIDKSPWICFNILRAID